MARYSGGSVADALEMAVDAPYLFDQIWYDLASAAASAKGGGPSWKRPGETAAQARDRLREERERAKRGAAAGVPEAVGPGE